MGAGSRGSVTESRRGVSVSVLMLLVVVACGGPDPVAPTISAFTASPDVIEAGETSTLHWQVVGTASLTLMPGGVAVTGESSFVVSPEVSTTYSLRAQNSAGAVSREVEVVVLGDATVALRVEVAGDGTGSVTTDVGDINVATGGGAVTATFDEGTEVTLTATPAAGSTFAGWTGGDCGGTGPCEVVLAVDSVITASFDIATAPTVELTVEVAGEGVGSVTSDAGGIAVASGDGATTFTFEEGAVVSLVASPAANSEFTGWNGADCDGTGSCDVVLDADTTITATFAAAKAAPVIESFAADPDEIEPGGHSTLSWAVSGATSLTLSPGAVDVTGVSSWVVTPDVSTTYSLSAENVTGVVSRDVVVVVGGPPVIASFSSESGLVNPGLPTVLAWTVLGADGVTLEGPGLPVRGVDVVGSLEVTPLTVGATYTLRATNGAGVVEGATVVSRAVPAFGVLIAGQSNAKGVNVSPSAALAFIAAAPGVEMLGNDYVWKDAYEPTGDCVGHVDLVSIDPGRSTPCTAFDQNSSGVSPGVSVANHVSAATGGEVFIVPAAKNGSALNGGDANDNWQPGSDRYDRETLFGSAAYRAQRVGIDRAAPLGTRVDGASYGAVLWYQGTSNTNSTRQTNEFFSLTDAVLSAFQQELAAPVILVQLSSRGDDANVSRNLLYQRVREVQRRMAEGARTVTGATAGEARAGRHLVVTHDLPMSDVRHLSAEGQWELGRRVSLAVREHLLGEAVDGTGPRLVRVEKVGGSSPTVVRVVLDRPVTASAFTDAGAYSGYFAAFSGGDEIGISEIVRESASASVVRITLSATVAGAVDVRYMPPAGAPSGMRLDVVRSASCADPIPGTSACLPLPAFGAATSAETASALRLLFFDDDED